MAVASLADSNLDWGQGLKSLARLQRDRPEFSDMTLYYFGDTEPAHYGVLGSSQVINAINDPFSVSRSRLGENPISGRLGLAPVGSLGPSWFLSDPS